VYDDGRGVPSGWNKKEKKSGFEIVFTTLHGSGKHADSDSYAESVGINGVGAAVTQGTSSTLFLTSAQSSALSHQNLQAYVVLEGWDPQYLSGLNARYLCGDTTFNGFVIQDTNGVNVLPSSITGFVNNQFWSPFTYGLSSDTLSWPTSIVLNTEN